MPRTDPGMNALESRKRLLIAESELNRAKLVIDLAALTAEAKTLATRAVGFGSLASSLVGLLSGLLTSRKTATRAAEPSWFQNLIKGAGVVASLWKAFRPR